MSGDRIFLVEGAGGGTAELVRATALVAEHAGVRVALIGGLAVTCRLAAAHRPTQDVDVVADTSADLISAGGTAASNLIDAGIAARTPGASLTKLSVGRTRVEIIETERLDPIEVAGVDSERSRLFVVSHRWALESATTVTISVVGTDVAVTVPVATASSLVAMKLHAIQDRAEDRKRASDAWDLYRLLETRNRAREVTDSIAAGPNDLASLVATALDKVFRTDVTRTRRWIQGYGDPEWRHLMTDHALESLATDVIDGLTR